jgi:calcium/calmodulin-dependent protein kinase I
MEINYFELSAPGNRLGSGEFGRVFESTFHDRPVVYKIMKHAIHSSIFFNEIYIMKQLSHIHIPQLIGYSICKKENFMCLIIEKTSGIDLLHMIQYYHIDALDKKKISLQIISTLDYIHSKNILLRDLKPENIIIHPYDFHIYFIDFGLAYQLTQESYIKGIVGTPGYIAPEIIKNEYYSYPIDIYSFGMTLFVLWSENNPKKYSLIHHYIKKVPSIFKTIILTCLQTDPLKRLTILKIIELIESDLSKKTNYSILYKYFCCFFST